MERIISQEERIRRAEEIYQRRRMGNKSGVRVSSSSVNSNQPKISLFKKMALQLAICSVIYIIFYLIKNSNYIFSEDVISKTKELLSHDINFENVYSQVVSFWEENKDKFKLPSVIGNEQINEILQENVNEIEEINAIEESNQVENTNQVLENEIQENLTIINEMNNEIAENTINEEAINAEVGGIGGAETNEIKEEKTTAETKKTQMELDAEYVKQKCNFIVPAKGTVTSRYGTREATEIVSANHYGIDIGNDTGTAIYASMTGTVTLVSSEGDYRKAC